MSTIHEEALQGSLLTKNKLDKYRQRAGASFDIDELDSKDRTALGYGAWKGHIGVVKLLVNEGANVNKLGKGDRSALWYAAAGSMPRESRLEIIAFLIENGAEVDEQSTDGYTPLMKVIIEHRDPEIISLLVDNGASKTVKKDGRTAGDFAERTKDPRVIKALLSKKDRSGSIAELVPMIVNVISFVLATVNSPLITDIVNGVAKNLYQISGDSAAIQNATQMLGPQTAEEFKKNINDYVTQSGLGDYFAEGDDFLQAVAEKAVKLKEDPSNPLRTDEDIRNLTTLALYQPVIYCDDSGSMLEDTRIDDQKELVRRIARIATRLVPDGHGAGLQFINYDRELNDNLSADEVEEIVSEVEPDGSTEIGTNLKKKILNPLVYDVLNGGGKLERPILVSIITDGCPSGDSEQSDTFQNVILECRRFLETHKYKHKAVRFQISQIGADSNAGAFLNTLRGNPKLEEILYCTTQQLDHEYKKLRENDEDLERWLLRVLMSPIMDRVVS